MGQSQRSVTPEQSQVPVTHCDQSRQKAHNRRENVGIQRVITRGNAQSPASGGIVVAGTIAFLRRIGQPR
jgi:hypothetical protein